MANYPNVYELSDGTTVAVPIRYSKGRLLSAVFLADLGGASKLLKGTGLHAVPTEDGKAMAFVQTYEYQITDLDPYNEFLLGILAISPKDPEPGIWVTDLPVTQDHTNRGGREIWGFPKIVTTIDIDMPQDGKKFNIKVHTPEDGELCSVTGHRGDSILAPPADACTLTILDGTVLRARVQIVHPAHLSTGENVVVKAGKSEHKLSENLRTLGLDGASPMLVAYSPVFQSMLHGGVEVQV